MHRFFGSLAALVIVLTSGLNGDAASSSFYPAVTVKGYSTPAINTRSEILARVKVYEAMQPGSPYIVEPVVKTPYNAGELNSQFLGQGLAAVNLYRFLAGLPSDAVLDSEWNSTAQYGAALLAIMNKGLTHTPSYPEGIGLSKDFYNRGYSGTSTSNLHAGQGNLGSAVSGFVYDSDGSNIDRVGHRRWVLYPGLSATGFGFANGYTAMKVFGKSSVSRKGESFAYSAWPPAGELPVNYFPGNTAWSFSLNPAAFTGIKGDKQSVSVKVKRVRDGRVWSFGGSSGKDGYFNIETSGFGFPYCVIFRPDNIGMINDGDTFEVSITGIRNGKGEAIPVKYRTGFFSTGDRIISSVISKHPSVVTVNCSWSTAKWGRKDVTVTNGKLTFGYTGVPVEGFSISADSPEGIIPIGFIINKSGKVAGPGDWVSGNGRSITSLKLLSSAGGYNIMFTVYCKAKGWSSWGKPGDELGFGPDYPIESISLWINAE